MAKPTVTLRDNASEIRLFVRRSLVAAVVVALLVGVLLTRLIYLQVLDHSHYTALSQKNRVNILPLPPTRGLIYDRNGIVLAENLSSFSLEIVRERVDDLDRTLAELGEIIPISESDIARFRQLLRGNRPFEGVPIRLRLSEEEVARFAVHRHRFPGVDIEARLSRHYPFGTLTAHSVGYVGRISATELERLDRSAYRGTSHIGKVGVEQAYESLLHGEVGYQQVESNAQGRILRVLERNLPTPGKNLHLNLDVRLQAVATKAFGEENGALVALDPNTGAVLALVSKPAYNPNPFVDGIDAAQYNALLNSRDQPLFNRALRGQYPPGSTIKPFVGLAGLELGEVRASTSVFCPGWYQLKNDERRYRDWKRHGHGHTDLDKAIVESCDVYFYDLALNLGIDRLAPYMSQFGFGQRTGIDIRGELAGLMPSREWKRRARQQPWFPGETVITGIGQGFTLTTPLQLAATTATFANHGQRLEPHVLREVEDPRTGTVEPFLPNPMDSVPRIRDDHWDAVTKAMVRVAHSTHGTARGIGLHAPYRIAGKTGTAQVFGLGEDQEYVAEELEKRLRDHALFVAFAPAEEPRIAIAVIVENGGSGGAVAAPVARKVMDYYLLGRSD